MKLPELVNSPLTGRPAKLERSIPSSRLVGEYQKQFGYDASRYFQDVPDVGVYLCDTGYRFYFPFTLTGDESLYRCLEQFEWNYKEDKWEHATALVHIRAGVRVLDVGCGQGNFLAKAKNKGAIPSGIELNKSAADIAQRKGIHIHEELIAEHTLVEYYDVVTSFQVLEHVPNPLKFIEGCVRVLRPGGTLIVGVPNDDGFLRLDPNAVLNQPPHHMGLWSRRSLASLGEIAGLQVQGFEIEPLAETAWYQAVIETTYLKPWQRRVFHHLGFAKALGQYVQENAASIAGHSIMVIYRKP